MEFAIKKTKKKLLCLVGLGCLLYGCFTYAMDHKNNELSKLLVQVCEKKYIDISVVEVLVKAGADVNIKDSNGDPLLCRACQWKNKAFAEWLIKNGADVNAKAKDGDTPLIKLCKAEYVDLKMVTSVIDAGANIEAKDSDGWTPLIWAALHNEEALTKLLIAKGADVNVKDKDGDPLLVLACDRSSTYTEMIELLVKGGANVNATVGCKKIPLLCGWFRNNGRDIRKLLVKNGADVNAKNQEGISPFLRECEGNGSKESKELVELMINRGADVKATDNNGNTPLLYACRGRNKELIELLIEKGADVNAKGKDGFTPLLWACFRYDNEEVIKLLIEKGADVNYSSGMVNTPLGLASNRNDEVLVELLIKKGADAKKGGLSLIEACSQKNKALMELLIRGGADVNARDNNGYSPLLRICKDGWHEVIKLAVNRDIVLTLSEKNSDNYIASIEQEHLELAALLINNGADVNVQDNEGLTPLYYACRKNDVDLVKLLLENKADTKVKILGETPLVFVCQEGYKELFVLLVRKGLNVNARGNNGYTPLDFVKRSYCYCESKKFFVNLLMSYGADISLLANDSDYRREYDRHQKLHLSIKNLQKKIEGHKDSVLQIEHKEFDNIDTLMLDDLTPIFAKQSALAKLVKYQDDYPKKVAREKLLLYCKKILFNHRVFRDNNFAHLLKIAGKMNAKDKLGRSIGEAADLLGIKKLSNNKNRVSEVITKEMKNKKTFDQCIMS